MGVGEEILSLRAGTVVLVSPEVREIKVGDRKKSRKIYEASKSQDRMIC